MEHRPQLSVGGSSCNFLTHGSLTLDNAERERVVALGLQEEVPAFHSHNDPAPSDAPGSPPRVGMRWPLDVNT